MQLNDGGKPADAALRQGCDQQPAGDRLNIYAFYLPQFHPIPENDEWWGKGFTEWTNTAKAKPLFRGHYQPHVPADLGFYDLRTPESRVAQADLARAYGIDGFCYYHYWFAGRRIIERPFQEVLESGKPDFPFMLCWANQTWTGIWHGAPNRVLIEQTYTGEDDHRRHFDYLLSAFEDRRYVRIDGKPIFIIYQSQSFPDRARTFDLWRNLASKEGLPGLHLVGVVMGEQDWTPEERGFDACVINNLPARRPHIPIRRPLRWLRNEYQVRTHLPTIYNYSEVMDDFLRELSPPEKYYQTLIPNWDNTPRSGAKGLVLHNWTPDLWRQHAKRGLELASRARDPHRLLFIKSWNEWAEGNHLEPDLRYGLAPLKIFRDARAEREAQLAAITSESRA
ncbi:MAG: glycoside hydrolase family 99-like domain-containing protein [Alphaproteobacteria bacterium]